MSQLLSLRERKRTETWAALHDAATRLTLEKGPEAVTVEQIAASANVSPRTFFNYFSTKEDAILGLQEPSISDRLLENFSPERDLLEQVSRLLIAVVHSTEGGEREASRRVEVLTAYPFLRQRRYAYFVRVEQLVRDVVAAALTDSGRWQAALSRNSAQDVARMIVLVAGAPMRYAMQQSADSPTIENQIHALDGATALLREVLEEIR
ncbi:TetR/AcrR family transcriptional regulator [uncultured Arthrobacter sp.]|uniref:TetR/AcrR family transcriptional regulator n=1 Tax=uncultured Arthrobacter sp. TaxID=114050 RepID=UPI00262CB590|nr:TetR/AcrR family transcriptional regulator [uncultured Arthrobacter sp.]